MAVFDPTKPNLGADLLTSATSPAKTAGQEYFGKFSTVPASKVVQAADVVRGLTGSWASQWGMGSSLQQGSLAPDPQVPPDQMVQINRIGQSGMPEINFVPYSHNTNRFAHKGGALLGHPISFSVVGPTLRQGKYVNWQWVVEVGASEDILRLDDAVQDLDGDFVIWAANPWPLYAPSITELYNITNADLDPLDTDRRFHGGLYLAIIHPGASGTLAGGGVGGLGYGQAGGVGIEPTNTENLWEIFRVTGVDSDTGLILDGGKRLSDYYSTPDGKIARIIMLFEPAASRLVAIPGSGSEVGREQVFAMLPPERALNSDGQLPFFLWKNATCLEQPWDATTFSTDGSADPLVSGTGAPVGVASFEYTNMPQLPVPRPRSQGTCYLIPDWHVAALAAYGDVGPGRMAVLLTDPEELSGAGEVTARVGDIFHIADINVVGDAALPRQTTPDRGATLSSLLGWFEVVEVYAAQVAPAIPTMAIVRRVDEVNPLTGLPFWGNGKFFAGTTGTGTAKISLSVTVHNPVKSLWENRSFDFDQVDSAKLTNIIDPRWTERKSRPLGTSGLTFDTLGSGTDTFVGATPPKADRAVFETASAMNPGNLRDLGFRVVLFPATTKTVQVPNIEPLTQFTGASYPPVIGADFSYTTKIVCVPDWSRPIEFSDILIDPAFPNERQFIEIDYANGLVRLSHAPSSSGGAFAPAEDIFAAVDNPRGEMVIFACLIPYSMEKGQLGTGIRVATVSGTVGDVTDCDQTHLQSSTDQADVYGTREWFKLQNGQTIGDAPADPYVILEGLVADRLPPAGFVELLEGTGPDGVPPAGFDDGASWRSTTIGYYQVLEDNSDPAAPITTLFGCWGWPAGVFFIPSVSTPGVAVLRRDIVLPSWETGLAGVPYAYDTTFGAAKRAGTLRFANSELQANADGSVTVIPQSDFTALNAERNLGDLFSSWVLQPTVFTIDDSVPANILVTWTPEITIIWQGQRKVIAANTVGLDVGALAAPSYLYIDGSDCTVNIASTLPLDDPEFILIAMAYIPSVDAEIINLQYPMTDIDKRIDIYVGQVETSGTWVNYHPCFDTLKDAIQYVNIIRGSVSGSYGPQTFIHIVGSTYETKLPIVIETNGLVIDGVPRAIDAPDTGGAHICWEELGPLLDFNGHSDIVFRGVNFLYSDLVAIDSKIPSVVAFTNTGVSSERIEISNCRMTGLAQGFIYSSGTKWVDCKFTDNWVNGVEDFGILLDTGPLDVFGMGSDFVEVGPTDTIVFTVAGDPLTVTPAPALNVAPFTVTAAGSIVMDNTTSPATLKFYGDGALLKFTLYDTSPLATQYAKLEKGTGGVATFNRVADPVGSTTMSFTDIGFLTIFGTQPNLNGFLWIGKEIVENTVIEGNHFIRNVTPEPGMTPKVAWINDADAGSFDASWVLLADTGAVTVVGSLAFVTIPEGDTARISFMPGAVPKEIWVDYGGVVIVANDINVGPSDHLAWIVCDDEAGAFTLTAGADVTFPSFETDGNIEVRNGNMGILVIRDHDGDYNLVAMGQVSGTAGCGIGVFSDFRNVAGLKDLSSTAAGVLFNKGNRIIGNTLEGFHIGIWANNLCHSEVRENRIVEAMNAGIIVGPLAVGNTIADNTLDTVFTEPYEDQGGPFLYPGNDLHVTGDINGIKSGLSFAGFESVISGNRVSIDETLPAMGNWGKVIPTYWSNQDIWCVYGVGTKIVNNTTSWGIYGTGSELEFKSNQTVNYYLNWVLNSISDGNIATTMYMSTTSGTHTITNNKFAQATIVGENIIAQGNQLTSDFSLSGKTIQAIGNIVSGSLSLTSLSSVAADITAEHVISGNRVGEHLVSSFDLSEVSSTVTAIWSQTVTGNIVGKDIFVGGRTTSGALNHVNIFQSATISGNVANGTIITAALTDDGGSTPTNKAELSISGNKAAAAGFIKTKLDDPVADTGLDGTIQGNTLISVVAGLTATIAVGANRTATTSVPGGKFLVVGTTGGGNPSSAILTGPLTISVINPGGAVTIVSGGTTVDIAAGEVGFIVGIDETLFGLPTAFSLSGVASTWTTLMIQAIAVNPAELRSCYGDEFFNATDLTQTGNNVYSINNVPETTTGVIVGNRIRDVGTGWFGTTIPVILALPNIGFNDN